MPVATPEQRHRVAKLSELPITEGMTKFTGRGRMLGAPDDALVGQQPTEPYNPFPNEPGEGGGEVPPDPVLAPVNVDVPFVSGGTAVGDTLTCTMGNWQGEPTSYAYAWSTGATGASYVIVAGDAGTSITCVVSATNAGGTTAAPPSNAVAIP
jgi:hypothetical protein